MRLLFVDDQTALTFYLLTRLRKHFAVDYIDNFSEVEEKIDCNEYDILIFTYLLPDGNGISMARKLRAKQIQIPILMVSNLSNAHMVEVALDAGIDDYVVKPYEAVEVLARLRALLRRPPIRIFSSVVQHGELELHSHTGVVYRQGRPIHLRVKEFLLLEYLARYPGQVITRSQLFEHVWNETANPFSNTIDAHINSLRKKIDYPFTTRLIKTVPGRGYTLVVDKGA